MKISSADVPCTCDLSQTVADLYTSCSDLHACSQPGESIGNVGQLAADLLIATCGGIRLVGYLESPYIQPCAGLDAFRSAASGSGGSVHLALELYEDAERGLLVLQQRAPVLRGCAARFAAQLVDWLQESGFSEVLSLFRIGILLDC